MSQKSQRLHKSQKSQVTKVTKVAKLAKVPKAPKVAKVTSPVCQMSQKFILLKNVEKALLKKIDALQKIFSMTKITFVL